MEEYRVRVYKDRTEWCNAKGYFHRLDGPACEYTDGNKRWMKEGLLHREDGPAVEFNDGEKLWYLEGKKNTEKQFIKKTQKHVITIDGKDVELSADSYANLKKSLNN